MNTKLYPDLSYQISDDVTATAGIVSDENDESNFSIQVLLQSKLAKEEGVTGSIMLTIPEIAKLTAVFIVMLKKQGIPALAIRVGSEMQRIALPDIDIAEAEKNVKR